MPATIEFRQVVENVIARVGHIFSNKPERQHFGEYLTGLLLAQRKSVNGIGTVRIHKFFIKFQNP